MVKGDHNQEDQNKNIEVRNQYIKQQEEQQLNSRQSLS